MPRRTRLELDYFDLRRIGNNNTCLFIGKRGSGKTRLTEDVVHSKRHIPSGIVFSPTEEGNETWGCHFPQTYIYGDYDCDILHAVVEMQKTEVRRKKSDPRHVVRPTMVVMDDCMYDKTIRNDKELRRVLMNGRHWKILLLITMQYVLDIGPDLRGQFDYVFVLQEKIRSNREKLWKNWFGIIPQFGIFNKLMDECTKDYGVLVLDNTSKSNDINKNIYFYRAQKRPPFMVGCRAYWVYHHSHFRGEGESREEDSDVRVARKRLRRESFRRRGSDRNVEISIRGGPR